MRVAYLCADPGIAYGGTKGASVHVHELTAALARAGAEVLLVVAGRAPGAAPPPPGVTLEILPGPAKGAATTERLSAELERVAWLERRLRGFEADVLYERLALHSAAGSAAARALRIPHVVELNAPLPAEAARYRRLDLADEAERLEHVVLGAAELVVGDGPGREVLEAAGARVTGALPHRDVPAQLAGADIGLAPYAHDAPDYFSPLKLFEYLAAGLATVAGDLPGVRDVVSAEEAVIVPCGDAPVLAAAVAALAADPARRRRL